MNEFILGVTASLVAAILYSVFISHRESQIREFLRSSSLSLFRWIYVRALVQAVRNDAAMAVARQTLLVFLFCIFASAMVISILASKHEASMAIMKARLNADLLKQDTAHPESLEELLKQRESLRTEVDALGLSVTRYLRISRVMAKITYSVFNIAIFLWVPYTSLRARLTHQINRLGMRLQGLATADELTRLTAAEVEVYNEATLKHYIGIMKDIAATHGIEKVTRTFDPWTK